MAEHRDKKGRPIVAITGMGIVAPLGTGKTDNWKKLTDELLAATKEVKEGKDGAAKRYDAAVNCMQSHKEHK